MKKVLNPGIFVLLLFILVAGPLIGYFLFLSAFSLFNFISFFFTIVILVGLVVLMLDFFYKSALHRYVVVVLAILLFYVFFIPRYVKKMQKETEVSGEHLALAIEKYRNEYGNYPAHLHLDFFKATPKKTAWGKHFNYLIYRTDSGDPRFMLSFHSFAGLEATLNPESKKWLYHD